METELEHWKIVFMVTKTAAENGTRKAPVVRTKYKTQKKGKTGTENWKRFERRTGSWTRIWSHCMSMACISYLTNQLYLFWEICNFRIQVMSESSALPLLFSLSLSFCLAAGDFCFAVLSANVANKLQTFRWQLLCLSICSKVSRTHTHIHTLTYT